MLSLSAPAPWGYRGRYCGASGTKAHPPPLTPDAVEVSLPPAAAMSAPSAPFCPPTRYSLWALAPESRF